MMGHDSDLGRRPHQLVFGTYTLDPGNRQLRQADEVVSLGGKAFDALVFLASHPGRVVSKQELKSEVWQSHVCDNSVEQAISKIRTALGDERQAFIQTVHGRGYQFSAGIQEPECPEAQPPGDAVPLPYPGSVALSPPKHRWLSPVTLCLAAALLAAAFGTGRERTVSFRVRTVSSSNATKLSPVLHSQGNVFFTELHGNTYRIAEVAQGRNSVRYIDTNVFNPWACDVSPDGNQMLVRSVTGDFNDNGPMFLVEPKTGLSQPLSFQGFDGAWSRDGKALALTASSELWIHNIATSQRRKLVDASGHAWWPRWSRDGSRLRFTVTEPSTFRHSIWEIASDGTGLRPWAGQSGGIECCGAWTDSGRGFVFESRTPSNVRIWLAEDFRWPWPRTKTRPITPEVMGFRGPVPVDKERRFYARLHAPGGEALKYDMHSDTYVAVLPGTSTTMLEYSPANERVAYLSAGDNHLWCARPDGTQRQKLVGGNAQVGVFRWSPDGKRLALMMRERGGAWRIAVAHTSGKVDLAPRFESNAVGPDWSPDGNQIVFGTIPIFESEERVGLYIYNLQTRQTVRLSNTKLLFNPRWSPDGQNIAALNVETNCLMLYDLSTGTARALTRWASARPAWDLAGSTLRYLRTDLYEPELYRLDLSSGRHAPALPRPPSRHPSTFRGEWMSWHPDGSPLVVRDASLHELVSIEPE